MLDEEFLKTNGLQFHGTFFQSGEVLGKFTELGFQNEKLFALDEAGLFKCYKNWKNYQHFSTSTPSPQQLYNWRVKLCALSAIQAEKKLYRIPLDAPFVSVLSSTANDNWSKLKWAFDVLACEIESRKINKSRSAEVLTIRPDNSL